MKGPTPRPYLCERCGEDNPEKFYKSSGQKRKCKTCHTSETHHKQRMMKLKSIEYLGGRCIDCGYDGNPWVFDFHHRNAEEKEWNWGNFRTSNWETIKNEIDKCDLLCSNCHRIRHHKEWLDTLHEHHPFFDNNNNN